MQILWIATTAVQNVAGGIITQPSQFGVFNTQLGNAYHGQYEHSPVQQTVKNVSFLIFYFIS